MSPETHLLASWLIAAKTTNNPRDCRLVTLAGLLPDLDGLGLVVDVVTKALTSHRTFLYARYHHVLLHGLFGAVVISLLLACFARQRGRVALLAFLVFHLHLLCDFLGSRGPSILDLWPIYYLGPFNRELIWVWKGQWQLDGWQNRILTLGLFAFALWLPIKRGDSVVGVFNRRVDAVFVKVLRGWHQALSTNRRLRSLMALVRRPPWRTVMPGVLLLGSFWVGYLLWRPGADIRDGRHDRARNGIWLGHGWLGGDDWFIRNHRLDQMSRFREPERIRELGTLLRNHHITDVFPHLCPADPTGTLPPIDGPQVERFLAGLPGVRVMPWIGGPNGTSVRYRNSAWRAAFIAGVTNLLAAHPGFSGVHLNVEPLPNGDRDFLQFLQELHAALPRGKILSVAAYPPPTRWHPHPDVHWDETYFKAVASHCDQMVVMMYDTTLRVPKLYQQLMSDWTMEVLEWADRKPVLLGIPTYDDAGVGYHHPGVENIQNALAGIHAGLVERPPEPGYRGVSIYCEWETDAAEWEYFRVHFLRP